MSTTELDRGDQSHGLSKTEPVPLSAVLWGEALSEEIAMSATGLDVFDKTLQSTHIWLDELMQEIGPDRKVAWHVLGAVLRGIRDRVPLELAVHLGGQLPILIRGTYYDQWAAPGTIQKFRS